MKRRKPEKESNFYKFAPSVMMLVTVAAGVIIWNYSSTVFSGRFAGYGASGKMAEVYLAFFKEPSVLMTTLGVLFLSAATLVAVVGALREKKQGALILLIITLVSIVAYAAILFAAISQIAS